MLYYNITVKALIRLSFCWLLSVSCMSAADTSTKPLVVTSIKPLAIIAKSALQDRAQVEYLISSAQSPHDTAIKLSDLKKLAKADLVLWVGPSFEVRAAKQLQSLPKAKLITALEALDLKHSDSPTDSYHHFDIDPHIWLSPTQANRIAGLLLQRLGLPVREILTRRQKEAVETLLAPVKGLNYLSHHDAIDYFVDEFKLKPALAIRNSMGERRGAKTQYDLRVKAQQLGIHCVFVEPQHGYKDALAMATDLSVPLKPLDLQALSEQGELISYESYILSIARQFSSCFE